MSSNFFSFLTSDTSLQAISDIFDIIDVYDSEWSMNCNELRNVEYRVFDYSSNVRKIKIYLSKQTIVSFYYPQLFTRGS